MTRLFALSVVLLATGCATEPAEPEPERAVPTVPLETRADSVAYRIAEASGGLEAWNALPVLRFDFGIGRDDGRRIAGRHYWDKSQNRYRVEWPGGGDSTYVAIFSDWPEAAETYLNGEPLDGDAATAALETARSRTINDTYWLLAPFKLFDAGVIRTYVADSSDATTEVIQLSFDGVGLTPGDRYWLAADRETGQLQRWTFALQDNPTARSFVWTAYTQLDGPGGPVLLSARKQNPQVAILTDQLRAPETPDESLFTDPQPRL